MCSLIVSFLHKDAKELKKEHKWKDFAHNSSQSESKIIVASPSQSTLHYVNFEGIVQKSNRSLSKPDDLFTLYEFIENIIGKKLNFKLDRLEEKNGL